MQPKGRVADTVLGQRIRCLVVLKKSTAVFLSKKMGGYTKGKKNVVWPDRRQEAGGM